MQTLIKGIFLLGLLPGFLPGLYGQSEIDTVSRDTVLKDRIDLLLVIPDTFELGEAIILPYKTYAEFRRAFVNLEENSAPKETAKNNMEIVQDLILSGVSPEMNSYENYRNRYTYNLLKPGGIIIFSTNPHQGIVPLIKKAMGKD